MLKKIVEILVESFAPNFNEIIKELKVYENSDEMLTTKGVFGNEDLMHSLLNNIVLQVVNSKFASERYSTKPNGKKGRADIVLIKNNKGIIIEIKYYNISLNKSKIIEEVAKFKSYEALKQAKSYNELIKNTKTQIFIGFNITSEQDVYLSGEIIEEDGNEPIKFDYP